MTLHRALLPLLVLAAASVAFAGEVPPIQLTLVASGFDDPVDIAYPPDGSRRLFIVERHGRIEIIKDGQLLDEPFLNLIATVGSGDSEQGLLGLAFHPDYATNGQFFVNYTDNAGDTVIERYTVSGNPDVANPAGAILLTVDQPETNHNGGDLAFSPIDGYLYIALGDGGGGNDPDDNGQDPAQLLGSILRIDVDVEARGPGSTYEIPPDNPFAGSPTFAEEIWAFGLRNPWRISFDRLTGDLFIGDVGQQAWEEIDYQPAPVRGTNVAWNFGWDCREGLHPHTTDASPDCASPVNPPLVDPILEYPHSNGDCSVTGGYLVRRPGALYGGYLYADYCTGVIRLGTRSGNDWSAQQLLDAPFSISTFGEDEAGKVYLADYSNDQIYRVDEVVFSDGFESGDTSAWSSTVN